MTSETAGTFVPMFDKPRHGKASSRVGWIVADNGCHLWQGGRNSQGYGHVRVDGRQLYVHRVRYQREVGPIPKGMHLDHYVCSTRLCCNPAHVRPVTQRENTLRGNSPSAKCAGKTHCPKGHPLSGDNLRPWDAARGERKCLTCARVRGRVRERQRRHALKAFAATHAEGTDGR